MSYQDDYLYDEAVGPTTRSHGYSVVHPNPVGTRTIRIADIPANIRRQAALKLIDSGDITEDQLAQLFELVFAPGDAGGRVDT